MLLVDVEFEFVSTVGPASACCFDWADRVLSSCTESLLRDSACRSRDLFEAVDCRLAMLVASPLEATVRRI